MKNWWWLSSFFILLTFFMACPRQPQPGKVTQSEMLDSALIKGDTMGLNQSDIRTRQDTVVTTAIQQDTLRKADQYHKGSGQHHEAPKHNVPDQMKLDSIKKSKKKD